MDIFVIHRFKDLRKAKQCLKQLSKVWSIKLQLHFLDSIKDNRWKQKAEIAINDAEAIVVFNPEYCIESDNSKWEIKKAKEKGKEILEFKDDDKNISAISRLISIYKLKDEFEGCFSENKDKTFELYKMMVNSSEELIQRRQRTNAFFITVIGSLLTIAGLLIQIGVISLKSLSILYGFSITGLLLCNSWRNLIDNYGKLNKAKFDVILKLEESMDAQIYTAEWIALGKGMRPQRYRSFTSTEKNVPIYFSLLIIALTLIITIWCFLSPQAVQITSPAPTV